MSEILNQFRSFSPFLKLLFLLMLTITGMIVITLLGLLIALPFYGLDTILILFREHDLENPLHLAFLRYFQIVSHFGMFIIPALVFAKLFEGGSRSYFLLRNKVSIPVLMIGGFVIVLFLPFVNYLAELNSAIAFPEALKGIESTLKTAEEAAEKMILAFLSQTEWYAFLLNMFMIAVIPAIGEELIFRGIVQRKLGRWFGNVHLAIFVTSIIFSAIHFQFYGFIPRVFLGMLLGYMFVWSGTIWLPVFAHFVNNGLAVTVAWLHASGYINADIESFGNLNNSLMQIVWVTLMAFAVLVMFWYLNRKTNPNFRVLTDEVKKKHTLYQ
jgi:uncharacterized protein